MEREKRGTSTESGSDLFYLGMDKSGFEQCHHTVNNLQQKRHRELEKRNKLQDKYTTTITTIRQTDRHTHKQTNRRTEGQRDRRTDGQIDLHML